MRSVQSVTWGHTYTIICGSHYTDSNILNMRKPNYLQGDNILHLFPLKVAGARRRQSFILSRRERIKLSKMLRGFWINFQNGFNPWSVLWTFDFPCENLEEDLSFLHSMEFLFGKPFHSCSLLKFFVRVDHWLWGPVGLIQPNMPDMAHFESLQEALKSLNWMHQVSLVEMTQLMGWAKFNLTL